MITYQIDVPEDLKERYLQILKAGQQLENELEKTGRSRALYLPQRRQPTSVLRRDAYLAALWFIAADAEAAQRYGERQYLADRFNEINAADFKPEYWQPLLRVDNEIGYSVPQLEPNDVPPRPGFFQADRIATKAVYTILQNKYFALDQGGGVESFQPGFVGDANNGFFIDKQYAQTITTWRTEYAMVPAERLPTFTIVDVNIFVQASDRGSRTFLSVMFKPFFDATSTPTPNNALSLPGHGKTFYWKWKRPTPQTSPYEITIDRQLLATAHEAAQWNSNNARAYQVHTGPMPPKGRLYANNMEVFIDHRTAFQSFQPNPCLGQSGNIIGFASGGRIFRRAIDGAEIQHLDIGVGITMVRASHSRVCVLTVENQLRLYDQHLDELKRWTPAIAPQNLYAWRRGFITANGPQGTGTLSVWDTNINHLHDYTWPFGMSDIFVGDYQLARNTDAPVKYRYDIRTGQPAMLPEGPGPRVIYGSGTIIAGAGLTAAHSLELVTVNERYERLATFPYPCRDGAHYWAIAPWIVFSNGTDPEPGAMPHGVHNLVLKKFYPWGPGTTMTLGGIQCQFADGN